MELLTIAEFAEKVGVTPQAIYKRLKADLAPFLVIENGAKLLKVEALELYKDKQPVSKPNTELHLEAEVERLKAELEAERKLNQELQTQLAAQSEKLLDILDRQTTQFQLLLAHQQTTTQQVLNAANQLNNPTNIETTTKPAENPVANEVTNPVETEEKKKGLLYRLFKRS